MLSLDPLGFDAGDPNLYRYVGNSPTNATDPTGLQDQKLGGTKYDLPECTHLSRLILSPDSKDKCLKDVPFWRKKDLTLLPKGVKPEILSGGRGWSGVIPDGIYIGPDGCGPCVGLVLVPSKPGMPTYVLHFTATQDVPNCLKTVGFLEKEVVMVDKEFGPGKIRFEFHVPRKGYKAIICGAEQVSDKEGDSERLHTLEDVTKWLRRQGVPIDGYVPAPGFCIDKNGKVYWTTPDSTPVDKYEK